MTDIDVGKVLQDTDENDTVTTTTDSNITDKEDEVPVQIEEGEDPVAKLIIFLIYFIFNELSFFFIFNFAKSS